MHKTYSQIFLRDVYGLYLATGASVVVEQIEGGLPSVSIDNEQAILDAIDKVQAIHNAIAILEKEA